MRDPGEWRPYDEPELVRQLGMLYCNIPVGGILDEAVLDRILDAMREHSDKAILVHCASGNRVCGALIPWLIQRFDLSEEAAVERAVRGGLQSNELLAWGLGYARARKP